MSDVERIRSDIELTRSELADTVDALQHKLDVRAAAQHRAEELEQRARTAYGNVKSQAPPSVQKALGTVETAAAPVIAKAAADKKRTALLVGATLLALLAVRRLRR